jgi:hypothetical protein
LNLAATWITRLGIALTTWPATRARSMVAWLTGPPPGETVGLKWVKGGIGLTTSGDHLHFTPVLSQSLMRVEPGDWARKNGLELVAYTDLIDSHTGRHGRAEIILGGAFQREARPLAIALIAVRQALEALLQQARTQGYR